MATTLRPDDKITVLKTTGGDKPQLYTIAEINEVISSEEDSRLTDLETAVGTYGKSPSDISKDLSGALTDIGDLQTDKQPISTSGAPTMAVAATGTLTATGNPSATATITIGTTTYTIVADLTAPAVPFEVKKGDTASDTLDNLIAAINAAAGAGSTYGTGTTAHPTVTAAAGDGNTVVITAKTKGVAGNSIATTDTEPEAETNIAFAAGALGTGVNGTPATAGDMRYETGKLWIAVADCTISDTDGWEYASLT